MAAVRRVAQPWLAAATLLVLAGADAGSAAARSTRITMTMEAGPEVDSNVGRVEPGADEAAVASALFRATSSVRATRRVGQNHALDLTVKGGARVFLEEAAREYDVGVLQAQGQWAYRTRAPVILGLVADHYEVFERTTTVPGATAADPATSRDRDFRFSGVAGQAILTRGPDHRVVARAGYRWFGYKPDAQFDFRGDTYSLEYLGHKDEVDADGNVDAEYDWHLGYALARRGYSGDVLVPPCPVGTSSASAACLPQHRDQRRRDLYHALSMGATYTGPIRADLDYQLTVTDSNSDGQSVLRHAGVLTLTKELPWRVVGTVRGELQLLSFSDPLVVNRLAGQAFESIEDENRNSLLVQLERPLDRRERLHLVGRYTLQSTSGAPLWRQLVFAGLSWSSE